MLVVVPQSQGYMDSTPERFSNTTAIIDKLNTTIYQTVKLWYIYDDDQQKKWYLQQTLEYLNVGVDHHVALTSRQYFIGHDVLDNIHQTDVGPDVVLDDVVVVHSSQAIAGVHQTDTAGRVRQLGHVNFRWDVPDVVQRGKAGIEQVDFVVVDSEPLE